MLDAIVVGAGPAGNETALKLVLAGHEVAVIDYRTKPGVKLCTGIVGRQCFEEYSVPASMILHEARSAAFITGNSPPVVIERDRPHAYVIDRAAFVASIADKARAAGARYFIGSIVNSVEVNTQAVRVKFREGAAERMLEARAVIVASGAGSKVAEMAGLSPARKFAFASQTVVETPCNSTVKVMLPGVLPQGHFGWVVPQGDGRALLGVLGRPRLDIAAESALHAAREAGIAGKQLSPRQHWPVPVGMAPVTSNHRALLVGDAAGQVKPTTGGGIYYSLLAADIAAETLNHGLKTDQLAAPAMKNYDTAWKTTLGTELRVGSFARSIFERLDGSTVATLLRSAETSGLLNQEGSFDWHSALIIRAMGYRFFDAALAPFRAVGGVLSAIV